MYRKPSLPACQCQCIHTYIHACICACVFVHTYVRAYVHKCIYACVCVRIYIWNKRTPFHCSRAPRCRKQEQTPPNCREAAKLCQVFSLVSVTFTKLNTAARLCQRVQTLRDTNSMKISNHEHYIATAATMLQAILARNSKRGLH